MKIQLVLAVCFASFGLISSQTADQVTVRRGNNESKIQQNFQNLFDSIAKKETRKSETYRDTLKHTVGREERAFDIVKADIQNRNSYRKRNFHEKRDVKRETNNKNDQVGNEDDQTSTSPETLCRKALHLAREVLDLENKFLIGVIQMYFRIKRRNKVNWEEQFERLLLDCQSIIDYDQSDIKARLVGYHDPPDLTSNPLKAVSITDLIQSFSHMMIILNEDKKLKAVDEEIKTIRRLFDNAEAELHRFNHRISKIMKRIAEILPSTVANCNATRTSPSNTL